MNSCRRCSTCGINYPPSISNCRVCNEHLDHITDTPDPDWQEQAERANADLQLRSNETLRIDRWRLKTLLDAGYTTQQAEALAARPWHQVDLHQAVELLARGCPADTAALILL